MLHSGCFLGHLKYNAAAVASWGAPTPSPVGLCSLWALLLQHPRDTGEQGWGLGKGFGGAGGGRPGAVRAPWGSAPGLRIVLRLLKVQVGSFCVGKAGACLDGR